MFRGFWGDSLILFTIIWGNSQPAVNGRDEICPEESREWSREIYPPSAESPSFFHAKKNPRIFGCSAFEFALRHIRLRVNKLPKKLTASLSLKMESWKTIRLPFLLGAISAYFQWLLLLVLGSVKVAEIVLIRWETRHEEDERQVERIVMAHQPLFDHWKWPACSGPKKQVFSRVIG